MTGRGLVPAPPVDKYAGETAAGFGRAVNPDAFVEQYGNVPVQPDDKSRVWGVDSSARLPVPGGGVREGLAQQCGYRVPAVTPYEKGAHSSLRSAALVRGIAPELMSWPLHLCGRMPSY